MSGLTPAAIARKSNAEGHRTQRKVTRTGPGAGREWGGKAWTGRRVWGTLTCSAYVGLVTHGRDAVEGEHPALVSRETFERVRRLLAPAIRRRGRAALPAREPLVDTSTFTFV